MEIDALLTRTNVTDTVGISPPAACLCVKVIGVLVSPDQIDKVVEHSDALVGPAGGLSCTDTPPLPPARVEHLEQVLLGSEGAKGGHPPKAQDAEVAEARLGERSLEDGLPQLSLVVVQGGTNQLLQRALVQPPVQSPQHLLLH